MTTNNQPVDGLLTLRLYTREGLSEVLGDLWVPDARVLKDLLNRSINLSEMSDVLRGSFIVISYESADPTSVEVTGIARLASDGAVTAFGIDFRKIAAEIVAPQFRVRLTNDPPKEQTPERKRCLRCGQAVVTDQPTILCDGGG